MGLYLGKRLGVKGKGICIGVPSQRLWKDGPYLADGNNYSPAIRTTAAQQTFPLIPTPAADGTTFVALTITLAAGTVTGQVIYFVFNMPVTTVTWAGTITGVPPTTAVLYTQVGFQWTGAAWALLP